MKNNKQQESEARKAIERYCLSNFDQNHLKQYYTTQDIDDIAVWVSNEINEYENIKHLPFPKDSINVFLASIFADDKLYDEINVDIISKVATLLNIDCINIHIAGYLKRIFCNLQYVKFNEEEEKFLIDNFPALLYSMLNYNNIHNIIDLFFPYLYSEEEIDELEKKLSNIISNNKDYNHVVDILTEFFKDLSSRKSKEYKNEREFDNQVEKNLLKDIIITTKANNRFYPNNISYYKERIKIAIYIIEYYKKEYEAWKYLSLPYKYFTSFCNRKYFTFFEYNLYVDGVLLNYFFETLNESHAFGKDQIDYIREMAPKLRIASYLNEEYANYKKLYNPVARDFYFGEDDPEEEATVISKDHLERLSHFKEEKLTNLLDKLKENQYIEKDTRPKDWLFAFGMSGDKKPEYFQKIQWIGRSNNRGISPSYFTDFIGILGYDLKKIYFEESKITISILNSCFMTTNKPIDQNSFNREKGEFIPTPKHKKMAKLVKECGLLIE